MCPKLWVTVTCIFILGWSLLHPCRQPSFAFTREHCCNVMIVPYLKLKILRISSLLLGLIPSSDRPCQNAISLDVCKRLANRIIASGALFVSLFCLCHYLCLSFYSSLLLWKKSCLIELVRFSLLSPQGLGSK